MSEMKSKKRSFLLEVPAADLFDKLTILQIKEERFREDHERHDLVIDELNGLLFNIDSLFRENPELSTVVAELKKVNELIWVLEDKISDLISQDLFQFDFVDANIQVRRYNKERFLLKNRISALLDSRLIEVKHYGSRAAGS